MFWEANRLRRKRNYVLGLAMKCSRPDKFTTGLPTAWRMRSGGTLSMVQWGLVANSFACLSSPFSLSSPSWASSFPKRSTSRDNPVRSALFATRNNVSETRAVAPRMKRCCSSGSAAFEAIVRDRADALLVFPESVTMTHRQPLAEFAAKQRLPSVFGWREYVEAGGLMSYGRVLAREPRPSSSPATSTLRQSRARPRGLGALRGIRHFLHTRRVRHEALVDRVDVLAALGRDLLRGRQRVGGQ